MRIYNAASLDVLVIENRWNEAAAQRSAANLSVSRTALLCYGKAHPYLLQTKKDPKLGF